MALGAARPHPHGAGACRGRCCGHVHAPARADTMYDPAVAGQRPQCPFLPSHRSSVPVSGEAIAPWWRTWTKKYVILCCVCGGIAVLLGVVFVSIYFTLHSYTTSLQYFETIPTYVPAIVLIVTGLLVICFARRKNRYAYLIKLAGGCCLVCALLCVVITVTTTVIHMNRLQTLRECVYAQKAKTCTCFAGIGDDESDGSSRYVFNNTPDCEVVHGSLYACLRAMFGLSVVGILVCIFSSMLVYQLLSHEKKKMYWEQLEMRRRFFYRQPSHYPYCNCCDDYGFAAPHDCYGNWHTWDVNDDQIYMARSAASSSLGRSPSPEPDNASRRSVLVGSSGHRASGWNWLPWNWGVSGGRPSTASSQQRQTPPSSQITSSLNSSSGVGGGGGGGEGHPAVFQVSIGGTQQPQTCSGDGGNGCGVGRGSFPSPLARASNRVASSGRHRGCRTESRFRFRRHRVPAGSRRRRSNDAIFHHLHASPSRYHPLFMTDGSYAPPLLYPTYATMRYAWGPPPPYSRPSSVENVGTMVVNRPEVGYHRGNAATVRPSDPQGNGSGMVMPSSNDANKVDVVGVVKLARATDDWERTESRTLPLTEESRLRVRDSCLVEVHAPYEVGVQRRLRCCDRAATLPVCRSGKLLVQPDADDESKSDRHPLECRDEDDSLMASGTVDSRDEMTDNGFVVSTSSSSSGSFDVVDCRSSGVVSATPSAPVYGSLPFPVDLVLSKSMPNLEFLPMDVDGGIGENGNDEGFGCLNEEEVQVVVMADHQHHQLKTPASGLSGSSPILTMDANAYQSRVLFPVRIFPTSAKSRSLVDISPQDNIIVSFKSIHV